MIDLEKTVIQDKISLKCDRISGNAVVYELEEIKVNSVHVKQSKEVNERKGIRNFYMFDNGGDLLIDGAGRGLRESQGKTRHEG